MYFQIPIVAAAIFVGFANAAALPQELTISEPIITDAPPVGSIERRDAGVHCYNSGAWMGLDNLRKGIDAWCYQHQRSAVQKGKEFASTVNGLKLGNGNPSYLNIRYRNDSVDGGWFIENEDCKVWLREVIQGCAGDNYDSQGGHYTVGSKGSVWIDPNAQ